MLYFDIQNFNQQSAIKEFTNFPSYIDKTLEKPEEAKIPKNNFHEYILIFYK